MGIRFRCPNGHRLNVKAYQAGKKARCPKCDVKLRIPMESSASSLQTSSLQGDLQDPATQPQEEEVVLNTADANGKAESAESVAASAAASAQQTESPPLTEPNEPQKDSSAAKPPPEAQLKAPPRTDTPRPAKIEEEDPDAVWYVRPPAGGQFGPAQGDVLKSWITDGRVSRDSYVWRKGWADWSVAATTFPELFSKSESPLPIAKQANAKQSVAAKNMPAKAIPLDDLPLLETPSSSRLQPRRKSKFWGIAAVVVLGLISTVLAGGLVYILLRDAPS